MKAYDQDLCKKNVRIQVIPKSLQPSPDKGFRRLGIIFYSQ